MKRKIVEKDNNAHLIKKDRLFLQAKELENEIVYKNPIKLGKKPKRFY